MKKVDSKKDINVIVEMLDRANIVWTFSDGSNYFRYIEIENHTGCNIFEFNRDGSLKSLTTSGF